MEKYFYIGAAINLTPKYGYTLIKRYNHKLYINGDISLWVIDKFAIEIKNLQPKNHINLIEFILKNKDEPESFWFFKDSVGSLPDFHVTRNGEILDFRALDALYLSEFKEWKKDESIPIESFKSLSGVFPIHLNLVKQVLELQDVIKKDKL